MTTDPYKRLSLESDVWQEFSARCSLLYPDPVSPEAEMISGLCSRFLPPGSTAHGTRDRLTEASSLSRDTSIPNLPLLSCCKSQGRSERRSEGEERNAGHKKKEGAIKMTCLCCLREGSLNMQWECSLNPNTCWM